MDLEKETEEVTPKHKVPEMWEPEPWSKSGNFEGCSKEQATGSEEYTQSRERATDDGIKVLSLGTELTCKVLCPELHFPS